MLTFKTAEGWFNYRVAGIAIRDGYVLVHKDVQESFWVLPGGRVEFMETAAGALRREILEETGVTPEVGRLVWMVENFFEYRKSRYHEIGLYFEMATMIGPAQGFEFAGREDAEDLAFQWWPLNDLANLDLQPRFLIARLSNLPRETEHLVQLDSNA